MNIFTLNEYEKKEKGNIYVSGARTINKLGDNMKAKQLIERNRIPGMHLTFIKKPRL